MVLFFYLILIYKTCKHFVTILKPTPNYVKEKQVDIHACTMNVKKTVRELR